MTEKKPHLHVVWIGGIGISAVARYYKEAGWSVSGSDGSASAVTKALAKEGISVSIGHDAANVPEETTLLAYSEAVITKPDLPKEEQVLSNPEIRTAKERGIRYVSYPEALSELFNGKMGIAVAGSHGKSTTTAMIGTALLESGFGGSTVVGTQVPQFDGKNGHFDPESPIFVIEACEYRRSFLRYVPEVAVITNIDLDHLDYYRDLEDYLDAFRTFLKSTQGFAVLNANCENSMKLARDPSLSHLAFYLVDDRGFTDPAGEYRTFPPMKLKVPGKHLAFDAKLSYVALLLSGVDEAKIPKALEAYRGSWRRSEIVGTTVNGNLVISDYGHHPTEIKPTLEAISEKYADRTVFTVFQPHQFSRTLELLDQFATSFDSTTELLVPDIYFSRDKKEDVEAMPVSRLIDVLKKRYKRVRGGHGLEDAVEDLLEYDSTHPESSVFVLLWAGNVDDLRHRFVLR